MNTKLQLAAVALLALVGCSSKSPEKDLAGAKERLIGKWEGRVEFNEENMQHELAMQGRSRDKIEAAIQEARKEQNDLRIDWGVDRDRVEVSITRKAIGDLFTYEWNVTDYDGDVLNIELTQKVKSGIEKKLYKITFSGPDIFRAELVSGIGTTPPIRFNRMR